MVKLSYINLKECYFKVLYTKVISLMQDKFVHYRNCYGDCKIYGIPCFAAPSGGGFLGNRFEDIKMYLNLSYNSWLATDSDYFYDSRNRWLL